MERGGRWIKWIFLLLGVVVVVGIASVLVDPGLGPADDAHRTRHAAGFSMAVPRGWGASAFPLNDDGQEMLRISPERATGRSTVIAAMKLQRPPTIPDNAEKGVFQNQPAFFLKQKRRYLFDWTMYFQRGDTWYSIILSDPIDLDVLNSRYRPFLDSFKLEPVMNDAGAQPPTSAPLMPTPMPASSRS